MIDYAKANPGSLTFATGNTAGRTSFSALPSVNALHKRRRCQETDLDFFRSVYPPRATTAAFDFCGNRHVPLAAQQS
jgi:hypothetical protein